MNPRHALAFCVLGALLAAGPAAARRAPGKPAVTRPGSPKVFRARYTFDLCNLDWNTCADANDAWALKNIMEGMFEISTRGRLEPRLLSSYQVSEDRKTLRFVVRTDVRWSDGVALEARHFYDSWKRVLDPATRVNDVSALYPIRGARAYHEGTETDFARVGIRLVSSDTLEISLEEPAPFFLEMLAFWSYFPIRADLIARHGADWTKPENLVVLGPYRLKSHTAGKEMVLERNPAYYGPRPQVDEVRLVIIKDDAVAAREFLAGRLEHYWTPDLAAAKKIPRSLMKSYLPPGTMFLMFDPAAFPLEYRTAVAQAIDKTRFSKAFHQHMPPAATITPPTVFTTPQKVGLGFNPKIARAAAARALKKDRKLRQVELLTLNSSDTLTAAKVVSAELDRHAGLKTKITPLDWDALAAARKARRHGIYLLTLNSDYLDPHSILGYFVVDGGRNKNGWWSNLEYDQHVHDAGIMPNGRARALRYTQALAVLQEEDVLVVPLFHIRESYFVSPKIKHFQTTPLGDVYMREIEFRADSTPARNPRKRR